MNSSIVISNSSSSASSIKNQSVGDGVDTLIELLSTATAEQAATILAILNRGMSIYQAEKPQPSASTEKPEKPEKPAKAAKPGKPGKPGKPVKVAAPVSLPAATEGAPTAEEYRLSASDIDSTVCVGRNLKGGDDKRWKPIVFRESQCGTALAPGSDLCSKCAKRSEKYAATPKPGDWSGRVTEEPLGWVHMLGTEWALEKKPRFVASGSESAPVSSAASVASDDASDSESESVSSQTEMPATSATTSVAATSDKKAAAAAAKAQKAADAAAAKAQKLADKEAAAAQKLAEKEAAAAKKLADKEAEKAKKLADKEAKKAEKPAKPAKVPATSAPTSASNSASAASEVTEVTEVSGELKLIDGTLYMVKTGNVYEYDELSEKAGDFVGRLTTDETIDTEAEEVSAVESDSE